MALTLQVYFADATRLAADDLLKAALLLPEDKRGWRPMDMGRSAIDQLAECVMINRGTVDMIKTHQFPVSDMEAWMVEKTAMSEDWERTITLLPVSATEAAEAILSVPDDQLSAAITMPFGPFTMQQTIAYPSWNMSYHQGQITFIHSLVEKLV